MTEQDYQPDFQVKPNRRKRRNDRSLGIGRLFFRVVLFLVIIEAAWLLIANLSVKPVVAQSGVIEKGCWAEALFLRNETIVTVPSDGRVMIKTPGGTRVPRGEILATIQSKDSEDLSPGTNLEAGKPDQWNEIQKITRENEELTADLKRMTDQMERHLANKKEIGLQKTNEELTVFLKEKNRILRTTQNNDDRVKQLNSGARTFPGDGVYITADQAGYWFPNFDGFEEKLTPDNFKKLQPDAFRQNYPLKTPDGILVSGTVCGKIISPFSQIIAVIVDPRQTGTLNPENSFKVTIDNETFPVELKDKITIPNGKMILGLEDTAMKIRQPNRRTRIYLIYQRTSGITIPVQALFKKGKVAYVKVIEGVGYKAKNIKVLASDGERAVVRGIDFGTTVLSR